MNWKRVVLSAAQITAGENLRLQNGFDVLWRQAGAPANAAMYSARHNRKGQFHFYFTPGAVMVALGLLESFGAMDCPEPALTTLSLHVGRADAAPPS